MTAREDIPDLPMLPPLYPAIALLAATALEWLAPLSFLAAPTLAGPQSWLGIAFIILGVALVFRSIATFRAAGTNVEPFKPSLKLVTDGPYRFSRNPIYIGFLIVHLGIGLTVSLEWGLILLPLVWLGLDRLVVAREEAYLTRQFGAEYEAFLARTRRWV